MQTVYLDMKRARILATRAVGMGWKGASFSRLSPVRSASLPDPVLGPHGVRVRNRVGLICGSDLSLVQMRLDPRVSLGALPMLDRIYLGHELCGEVVEVGEKVTSLRPGQRVALRYIAPHCLSQDRETLCPPCRDGQAYMCHFQAAAPEEPTVGGGWGDSLVAHQASLRAVADGLSDDQVALLEPAAVALHAALRELPAPGARVLVLGCGVIGLLVVQALHALAPEAEVMVLARHDFQAHLARRYGAADARVRADGYKVTAEVTGARLYRGAMGSATLLGGFDQVYDCVGSSHTLTDTLRWVRADGAVILVGWHMAFVRIDPTPLFVQDVRLIGSAGHGVERLPDGTREDAFDLAGRLFTTRRMTDDGLISHRFPRSEWKTAVRTALSKREHHAIKVALVD